MTAPIDFVYTWVDGELNAALRDAAVGEVGTGANRFRDNSELFHSIESVRIFAPWVRRVFVVAADGQSPEWYDPEQYPNVEVVPHSVVFGEHAGGLPVFNSHAIEAVLHQIPGLSERFVYFNDDMFLGAPARPSDFFSEDGTAVVRTSETITPKWNTHRKEWRVYRGKVDGLLRELHPGAVCYNTAHQARTLLKSVCEASWQVPSLREHLLAVVRAKFRSKSDIAPIELFANQMLLTDRASRVHDKGVVLCIFDNTVLKPEFWALERLRPAFYCINDDMKNPSQAHLRRLREQLATGLPHHGAGQSASAGSHTVATVAHSVAGSLSRLNRLAARLTGGLLHNRL